MKLISNRTFLTIRLTTVAIIASLLGFAVRSVSAAQSTAAPVSTPSSAAPVAPFSLADPGTWPTPSLQGFSLLDPNSWPIIPIPIITTDPNGGTTYGLMAVKLFHDDQGDISSIFAPDVTKNTTLGVGGDFRYFSYPSADTHWYGTASAQYHKARNVDVNYQTGITRQSPISWSGRLFWEHDPTERFYGVGNMSFNGMQSNYMTKQIYAESVLGYNFNENMQLAWIFRPRYERIGPGGFTSLPATSELFPHLKGLDGGSEIYNSGVWSYDNRDSTDLPHKGGYYEVFYGLADRRLGSSMSYNRFGYDLHHYFPLWTRFTLATHAYMSYIPAGNETPFFSMARLGGEASDVNTNRCTQRGWGVGRWTDNNIECVNAELRTKVYTAKVFDTTGTLEMAPFVDMGKVSHYFDDNPVNRFHTAGGVGIRAVAEPYVVGFVDIGYAGDGETIFAGVNYPF
jgi:hypothetical protein